MKGPDLHGVMKAPILLGIVGGVTRLHPVAKICLKILNIKSAAELSRIVAAVGLVQNLAALTALVTEGISKGHMRLHISNLALHSGAAENELPLLKKALLKKLEATNRISSGDAVEILKGMRSSPPAVG